MAKTSKHHSAPRAGGLTPAPLTPAPGTVPVAGTVMAEPLNQDKESHVEGTAHDPRRDNVRGVENVSGAFQPERRNGRLTHTGMLQVIQAGGSFPWYDHTTGNSHVISTVDDPNFPEEDAVAAGDEQAEEELMSTLDERQASLDAMRDRLKARKTGKGKEKDNITPAVGTIPPSPGGGAAAAILAKNK